MRLVTIGLRSAGGFAISRHREIAVDRQSECSRDRRRRHVQHVRRTTFDERLPLLDAEAMLLVDHGHGEPRQLDAVLNQRVRAHHELRVGIALDRPSQQCDTDAELRAQSFDREKVLLRKRLGRRHQRTLALSLDGAQQRVERDDRLARAHVALQEPLHRHRAGKVGVDLRDRALLVLGQLERKCGTVAREQLSRLAERGRDRRLARTHGARDPEL